MGAITAHVMRKAGRTMYGATGNGLPWKDNYLDHEKPKPWPLERLRSREGAPHVYAASEFRLHKRRPLHFPPYVALTDNYFDRGWVGERRLKNVVVIAEWVPDSAALKPAFVAPEAAAAPAR